MQGRGEEHFQLDPEDALLLRGYVERFLQSSYNILMNGLQKDLDPGLNISRLTHEDFMRFFKLTSFFTRYVRLQEVQTLLLPPTLPALLGCAVDPVIHVILSAHDSDLQSRICTTNGTCFVHPQENKQKAKESSEAKRQHNDIEESPYAAISATLGWETFRLVHSTWLTAIELPQRNKDKWDMQVWLCTALLHGLIHLCYCRANEPAQPSKRWDPIKPLICSTFASPCSRRC
jgi:hypothetical protein